MKKKNVKRLVLGKETLRLMAVRGGAYTVVGCTDGGGCSVAICPTDVDCGTVGCGTNQRTACGSCPASDCHPTTCN